MIHIAMKYRRKQFLLKSILIVGYMIAAKNVLSQPVWKNLPALPDSKGWAGMYAGVSNGLLFCMGGANFPGKLPWEGGKKKWYDHIYLLNERRNWIQLKERLPAALGYGVSVSDGNEIILIGGSNETGHSNQVFSYTWTGCDLQLKNYPQLPVPLANMAGALVGRVIVIAGGSERPDGPALRQCYALDLEKVNDGWFSLDPWPGPGRNFPVCAQDHGRFYLFSGETSGTSAANKNFPLILQDAFRLTLTQQGGKWIAEWQPLSPMPRGIAAGGSPLPVLDNGKIMFWGGVDAVTRLQKDPVAFTGISGDVLLYDLQTDTWEYGGVEKSIAARVTLPVVFWNGHWIFIGGETRPGVRTNAVSALMQME